MVAAGTTSRTSTSHSTSAFAIAHSQPVANINGRIGSVNRRVSQNRRVPYLNGPGLCVNRRSTLTTSRRGSSSGGCPNQEEPGRDCLKSATVHTPMKKSSGKCSPAGITTWFPMNVLSPSEVLRIVTVPRWRCGPPRYIPSAKKLSEPTLMFSGTTSMMVLISHPRPTFIPASRSQRGQNSVPLSQVPADSTSLILWHTRMYSKLHLLMTDGLTGPTHRIPIALRTSQTGTHTTDVARSMAMVHADHIGFLSQPATYSAETPNTAESIPTIINAVSAGTTRARLPTINCTAACSTG